MKTLDWIKGWKKIRDTGVDEPMSKFYDRIEKFIEQTLISQHKERMERIEGMKSKIDVTKSKCYPLEYFAGWNKVLDEIIKSEQSLYGGKDISVSPDK